MRTRFRLAACAIALGLLALQGTPIGPVAARAQSYDTMDCNGLWYARNAIYADKGYCFKTERARAVFGPGCFPPYGQLTPAEQSQVALIQQWESHRGCAVAAAPPPPPPPPGPPPPSGDYSQMSCDGLWYARNTIYAAKGYCFKTERARSAFGPGCFPPYGQLTAAEQNRVAAIQQWERTKGCR
jgi:hypothetical protein